MAGNVQLSKNFWLNELIKSSTADRKGIDNTPTTEHLVNLTVITHAILQPVSCLLYTSPSPRDATLSRMPSSA